MSGSVRGSGRRPRVGRWGPALVVAALVILAGCTSSAGTKHLTPTPTAPVVASSGDTVGSGSAGVDWPAYHGDAAHSGLARTMPRVHGKPTVVADLRLDGAVYASPIVVGGLTIVATENDSVYAFDSAYHQVWKRHLGSPSPAEERQCGNITPLGITGTPVYDDRSGSVFVVAEMAGSVRHVLFALAPTTGATTWSKVVDLPGVSARDMQQRGALALAHGRVWVSFGAQAGDCGNYKGRVVGVRTDGAGLANFYSPPTRRGGGIWNPAGPTLGPDGDLLVVSANGAAFPGAAYDHTNSVLRINGAARRVDSFAPKNWAVNNRDDVGLGSQGVSLVDGKWAVLGGKSGPVYVLHADRLGGIGGQVSKRSICRSYGGAAVNGDFVFLPCTDGVRAVRVDSTGHLHVLWLTDGFTTGSPVVGGGRVWSIDPSGGVLHGLDIRTGKSLEKVMVGTTSRFATPAIHGADVLVPTLAGFVAVRTS